MPIVPPEIRFCLPGQEKASEDKCQMLENPKFTERFFEGLSYFVQLTESLNAFSFNDLH